MSMTHRCWAEVDLEALRENLAWIRQRVGPEVRIMTVVKADAYGHGLKHIASHLMRCGTDVFGVANLGEARAIRSVGRGWPILMLGACLPDEVEAAVEDDVMPTVSTMEEARLFAQSAVRLGRTARVHVKVDTGMGRLGVEPAAAAALVRAVAQLQGVVVEGVFTHFASAEDDEEYTALQLRRFRRVLRALAQRGVNVPWVHASNSGGILHAPESCGNLVRPGLMVYGVVPPGRRRSTAELARQLQPALSFRCRVGLVKTVRKGSSLSYGRTYVAPGRMRVATITAGYGDGFPRAASNRACVLLQGQRCPVVGRVTMDQTLVDVSSLGEVVPGDEAVLIGAQGEERVSATDLAAWCGTIPWEILTGISYRVPRVYRGAQAA